MHCYNVGVSKRPSMTYLGLIMYLQEYEIKCVHLSLTTQHSNEGPGMALCVWMLRTWDQRQEDCESSQTSRFPPPPKGEFLFQFEICFQGSK